MLYAKLLRKIRQIVYKSRLCIETKISADLKYAFLAAKREREGDRETERDRQRETETDRERQRQTERERDYIIYYSFMLMLLAENIFFLKWNKKGWLDLDFFVVLLYGRTITVGYYTFVLNEFQHPYSWLCILLYFCVKRVPASFETDICFMLIKVRILSIY